MDYGTNFKGERVVDMYNEGNKYMQRVTIPIDVAEQGRLVPWKPAYVMKDPASGLFYVTKDNTDGGIQQGEFNAVKNGSGYSWPFSIKNRIDETKGYHCIAFKVDIRSSKYPRIYFYTVKG